MTLKSYSDQILPSVETEIHKVVEELLPFDDRELRNMMAYHLGWEGEGAGPKAQGKRLRPLMLLLVSAALSGHWEANLPAAASVELLHNFSLIHDDIQDASDMRRNRPTVWVKWGIPQAINAGDTMFTLAQLAMLRLSPAHSAEVVLKASQVLNQTCIRLTYGQYLDMDYEKRVNLGINDYWPMIEGKTAALLSTCATLGAVLAHSSLEAIDAFQNYGFKLGLAFQIQDDLLGIWGNQAQLGKSTESDLATGKKTFPVLYANEQKGEYSRRWGYQPVPLDEIPEAIKVLTAEGAYDYTKTSSDSLTASSLDYLEKARPYCSHQEAFNALTELTNSLLQRSS